MTGPGTAVRRADPDARWPTRWTTCARSPIMGRIDDGGPELPTGPGPAARDDPDAMARLRATFVDGTHGWVDDTFALARPWGFDLATITVPVGLWRGSNDANVPSEHADYLLAHIPTAQGHVYTGGHLPGAAVYDEIYDWLHTSRGISG